MSKQVKIEAHMLLFGPEQEWMKECVPTVKAWAERHGIPITTWDDTPAFEHGYPTAKFCERQMMEAFLAGGSDFMIYVDADVWVHPEAPLPPLKPGLSMATDCYHAEHQQHWTEWCAEHKGFTPDGSIPYSNAGVFVMDRAAAKAMLEHFKPPFVEFFQDQHEWNAAVYRAHKEGMPFNELPGEWNRFGRDYEPAWARHFWSDRKIEDLQEMRESGMLCKAPDGLRYSWHPGHTPHLDKIVYLQFVKDSGLGNRLFELAAGIGIAKKNGAPIRLNWLPTAKRECGLEHFGFGVLPFREVPVVSQKVGQGHPKLNEHCQKAITASSHRIVAVSHPFQCEECFGDVADEIRELFKLEPFDLQNPPGTTAVGVQVRRGDYVGHSRLNVCTPEYFRNAMTWMRRRFPNPYFIVVSDDPAYCRQLFRTETDVRVMPPQEAIDGLRTLASCDAHVISNSTFGWWGAWLGEKGPVCVPEIWHHQPGSYGNWKPAPDRWQRIPIGTTPILLPQRIEVIKDRPKHDRAIVYPWHADKAAWEELRYSLRSVDRFLDDTVSPIYILGTRKPDFLTEGKHRVKYIGAYTYRQALEKGTQIADEVMWMNDDIWFLKPCTWAECAVPRYLRDVDPEFLNGIGEQTNPWRQGVVKVLTQLREMGVTDQKVFSTHTPYVFNREKVMEVFEKFGAWEKFPLELAVYHLHGAGAQPIGDMRTQEVPFGDATWLNCTDRHLTEAVKGALMDLLPEAAPWEVFSPRLSRSPK